MTETRPYAQRKVPRLSFASETYASHDAQKTAGDLVWDWNGQHQCVFGVWHGGRDSEEGGTFGFALRRIPSDDALKELLSTLAPLVGPVEFTGLF